ncbi:MAG: hypothetical protein ABR953_08835 [Candidatus Acidiferrales bacterium]|jgi:hypothetical protein
MVKNDGVASEEQIFCEHYAAPLRSVHRGALCRRKIYSSVRRPWLTVKDPAASKVAACLDAVERQSGAALPQSVGSHTSEQFLETVVFLFSPLAVFRTYFDELLSHLQLFDCEPTSFDGYKSAAT